jgi:hypothetical protein
MFLHLFAALDDGHVGLIASGGGVAITMVGIFIRYLSKRDASHQKQMRGIVKRFCRTLSRQADAMGKLEAAVAQNTEAIQHTAVAVEHLANRVDELDPSRQQMS